MNKKIGLGLLMAMMATAAHASCEVKPVQPSSIFSFLTSLFSPPSNCSGGGSTTPVAAPEIDPASAMAGLTLMGAGLVVLRGRRKSK